MSSNRPSGRTNIDQKGMMNDFGLTMEPLPDRTRHASVAYVLIRWLFRFVLRVFYSQVIVEGSAHVTPEGIPSFLVANHANSLTDALLMVTTVPTTRRKMLRLTAKDTQFGRGTFSSYLIEAAGTLPIKRPKDHLGQRVDNSIVFAKLIDALADKGACVCMFPEGMSRYHPELAPMKQGVSRIVSDVLVRKKDNPDFQVALQPCSINYLHRNLFRSDVLVTFHPPIIVSARTHPGLTSSPVSDEAVRQLTNEMRDKIRSGLLEAPSWSYIRAASTARRLYAPLGTKLGLGDHVRLTQRFVDAFAGKKAVSGWDEKVNPKDVLKTPMLKTPKPDVHKNGGDYFGNVTNGATAVKKSPSTDKELEDLKRDLETYQNLLWLHGIKDDRVRNPRLLRRSILIKRFVVRVAGAAALLAISIPGLCLWAPIFAVTKMKANKQMKSGPVFDTYDEVAQTKLVWGLLAGVGVYLLAILLTLPFALITAIAVPCIMWLTLRWLEDFMSSVRATLALLRLLLLGPRELQVLREMRESLRQRVVDVAEKDCGLPRDSDKYLEHRGRWRGLSLGFFSLTRRRKKDWNETLKLWDLTEYPDDDLPAS